MYPLLFPGDRARVRRCGAGELAAGDVVVFLDLEGGVPRQVAHRLLRASGPAGRLVLRTKGDANFLCDPPLPQSAVLGRVEAVVTFGREWPLAPTAARRAGLVAAALAPALSWLRRHGPRAFAGTAALLAARRAVLAAVSGEPTAAPGAAEAAADGFFGFLSRDETWSGAVRLGGDVFVPPGVTLTLAPGTVLDAAPDSLWSLSAPSGRGGPCALHVAGRLAAGGTQTRSRLGGPGVWGGLRLHPGGAAALSACDASGGVSVGRGASATLEDCRLEGAALRLEPGARAVLRGCAVTGAPGAGASAGPGARLELTDCRLERNGCGLEARGAHVTLRGGALTGNAGCGAHARGGTLEADGTRFDGNGDAGLLLSGGASAVLRGGGADENRVGLAVNAASLNARDWSARDNIEAGLDLAGGRGTLERVRVAGGLCGARVSGGFFEARELTLADSDRGVVVSGGELRWDGAGASGAGLEVGPGAKATVGGVAGRVAGGPGPLRRALLSFVLATRDLPGFGGLYGLLYGLPVRLTTAWARREPGVTALLAHHSWATGRWRPGTSDVDLVVVAADLAGEAGWAWQTGLWRRAALLRRFFPFLGELLVMEPADWRAYLAEGRGRAEPREAARVLCGAFPAAPEPVAPGGFERFAERAHSYTRLMARLYGADPAPWSAARLQAAKALAELGAPALPSARADLPAAAAQGLRAFHRDALDVLSGLGAPAAAPPSPAPAWPVAEAELRRSDAAFAALRARLDGRLAAACADSLYRSYYVLEDEALDARELPVLLERIGAHAASRRGGGTLPVVLSWSAWALWNELPYLELPGLGAERAPAVRAGRDFAATRRFAWSARPLPGPRLGAAAAAARDRECLATFRAAWRFHASEHSGHSPAYALHYLYTRALGLRLLLERGERHSFFDLDGLAARYRACYPEEMAGWEERWKAFPHRLDSPEMGAHARWLDRQLRWTPSK